MKPGLGPRNAVFSLSSLVPAKSPSNIANSLPTRPGLLVIIWFPRVPVLEAQRFPRGHPDKLPLLSLVSARGPEVFLAQPDGLDVLLQQPLLRVRGEAGQVEAVVPAVLG